jgi:hypothetical protein
MKRTNLILVLATIFLLCGIVAAQQPTKPATPAQEAEAAQKQLVAAVDAMNKAFADYNVAAANRNAAFYKVLAETGVKPSECVAPGEDGKPNPFACVKIDPATGAVSAEKPKTEAAKGAASPAPR